MVIVKALDGQKARAIAHDSDVFYKIIDTTMCEKTRHLKRVIELL